MKKTAMLLLCVLLSVVIASAACAEGIVCAGKLLETDRFAHYPAYALDQETGRWNLHAYQADALLDRFWSFGMRNSQRTVVFHLAAEGDARTGVWTPVLRFYYIDGEAIGARAVSVLADGRRYDLAAVSETVRNGRYSAECMTAPLDEQAMQLVESLLHAQQVTVRLIGEKMHTTVIDRSAQTGRAAVEAASLVQMESGVLLLQELGVEQYGLWDLSADAWESLYGFRPLTTHTAMDDALGKLPVEDALGMILPDTSGDHVIAAQEKLIEHGFLSGSAARTFDDAAGQAVLRAQKYLGRVQTGCFDAALMDALDAQRVEEQPDGPVMHKLGAEAEIGLERFWFADAVSASASTESMRTVVNGDNVFLAADGAIRNLSVQEMHLFMQLEASVLYNDQYAYEAQTVCECSAGAQLDSRLLPLAKARLLVFAEIPAELAQDENARWSIVFSGAGEQLVFELQ